MYSMTGFGQGEVKGENILVKVSVYSVNRRLLEIRINLPDEYHSLEFELRKEIESYVGRGAVTVDIKIVSQGTALSKGVIFQKEIAESLLRQLQEFAEKQNLNLEIRVSDLLSIPNVIQYQVTENDAEQIRQMILTAFRQAILQWQENRLREGMVLKGDLLKKLSFLREILNRISELAPTVPTYYRQRLLERIRTIHHEICIEEEKILKEVLFFSDRCDISEEITRLKTHLDLLFEFFQKEEPQGKRIDFLLQEIHREITTLGNKAMNTQISHYVVDFKTELERIREQIQNIE